MWKTRRQAHSLRRWERRLAGFLNIILEWQTGAWPATFKQAQLVTVLRSLSRNGRLKRVDYATKYINKYCITSINGFYQQLQGRKRVILQYHADCRLHFTCFIIVDLLVSAALLATKTTL